MTPSIHSSRSSRHPSAGHRQRLRKRLDRAGLDALADYEILEFLLGLASPFDSLPPVARSGRDGRDVKPLARALSPLSERSESKGLKAFGGSLGRLLDAPRADVLAVPGAGPAVADALLAALLPLEADFWRSGGIPVCEALLN